MVENVALRTSDQLGLTWDEGFDGGTDVIDYLVQSDQSLDVWTTIASGVTERSFTVTGLTIGTTYTFRVKARNSFGYSNDYSAELSALCAGPPEAPQAPVTTADWTDIQV